jgi:FkbM family methyltransferase
MSSWLSRRTFPILRGPLAGKKWLLASRTNFFLGTYEPEQTQAFQRVIKPGDIVYDVGAHYGYYTLLSSILAGPTGKVFAFEPSPANIARLQAHLRANGCANVSVEELALSDAEGTARFDNQTGSGTAHLSSQGSIEVRTATLDSLGSRLPPPQVVKIDCEGAEVMVLEGGEKTLRSTHPAIFLSTHGEDLKQACFRLLGRWGYSHSQLHGDDYLFSPDLR